MIEHPNYHILFGHMASPTIQMESRFDWKFEQQNFERSCGIASRVIIHSSLVILCFNWINFDLAT